MLIEARVVLPGVQALLGFQFVVVLTDSFERLPPFSQYVHLASLGLMALAMILLMTPPPIIGWPKKVMTLNISNGSPADFLMAATLP